MKKKLGPLPMWAWIVIAGGTIGILWYLRSRSSSPPADSSATDATLPDTAGAPPDASGGSSGNISTATPDDIYNALLGIQSQLAALPGEGPAVPDTPVQTFAGEIGDVSAGVAALQDLMGLLGGGTPGTAASGSSTHVARSGPHKGEPYKRSIVNGRVVHTYANGEKVTLPKKRTTGAGSGGAGRAGRAKPKPVRRTVTHKTTEPAVRSHAPAAKKRIHTGGNAQKHRTAKPKAVRGHGRVG